MKREVETKWYKFYQNNSGGSFDINHERGIGPNVWIEALDADDANRRAEQIGIYFDGVSSGCDCSCCGDRWYHVRESCGENQIDVLIMYDFNWHDKVYAHTLDGEIHSISKQQAENLQNGISAIRREGYEMNFEEWLGTWKDHD